MENWKHFRRKMGMSSQHPHVISQAFMSSSKDMLTPSICLFCMTQHFHFNLLLRYISYCDAQVELIRQHTEYLCCFLTIVWIHSYIYSKYLIMVKQRLRKFLWCMPYEGRAWNQQTLIFTLNTVNYNNITHKHHWGRWGWNTNRVKWMKQSLHFLMAGILQSFQK